MYNEAIKRLRELFSEKFISIYYHAIASQVILALKSLRDAGSELPEEKIKALWAMCRKNELYTIDMFVGDLKSILEPILAKKDKRIEELEAEARMIRLSAGDDIERNCR